MINWLKGWKGIAIGAAFILLSLIYNSALGEQITSSAALQIPGYILLGLGSVLVLFAALASPEAKKAEKTENSEEVSDENAEEAPAEEDV